MFEQARGSKRNHPQDVKETIWNVVKKGVRTTRPKGYKRSSSDGAQQYAGRVGIYERAVFAEFHFELPRLAFKFAHETTCPFHHLQPNSPARHIPSTMNVARAATELKMLEGFLENECLCRV